MSALPNRPWPPDSWPTGREFRYWFLGLPQDVQVSIMDTCIADAQHVMRCRIEHPPFPAPLATSDRIKVKSARGDWSVTCDLHGLSWTGSEWEDALEAAYGHACMKHGRTRT